MISEIKIEGPKLLKKNLTKVLDSLTHSNDKESLRVGLNEVTFSRLAGVVKKSNTKMTIMVSMIRKPFLALPLLLIYCQSISVGCASACSFGLNL